MEHALPRTWSLCMTSENHGTVGPAGCTFSHAPEKHERVLVVEVPAAANKAEVDLSSLARYSVGVERCTMDRDDNDGNWVSLREVKALLATPPATTGASTVLTDEQIIDLWNDTDGISGQSFVITFAHALIREVAAQAGQVAVLDTCTVPPEGWYCTRPVGHDGPCAAWPCDQKVEYLAAPSPAKESK